MRKFVNLTQVVLLLQFTISVRAQPPSFIEGEIIVSPAVAKGLLKSNLAEHGLLVIEEDSISGLLLVATPRGAEQAWINTLANDATVLYAERNGRGSGGQIPDDTFFGSQWHLRNTGQSGGTMGADVDAAAAWDLSMGRPQTVIAVLDTGIDSDHPEFAGRIDPDGFDFVNDDSDPEADHPHGSWVSGVIAANPNNSFAVAGIDWRCKILPIKILTANNFGSTFDLVQGINYAASQADVSIISMSLINFPNAISLRDALQNARSAGKILIACAGNGGLGNADTSYPGAYGTTIAVGWTNRNDARNSNSGTGDALDFVAPGTSIVTVRHNSALDVTSTVGGCSFATPLAAGIAGLLLDRAARYGRVLGQDDIFDLLLAGAEDQVGPAARDTPGWDEFYGHGRLNAYFSLLAIGCPPDITGDGQTDIADLALQLSEFGVIGEGLLGDIDQDGDVDLSDLSIMLGEFGRTCPK